MILDRLDGRVARLVHTQSAFGAEYDSLADMAAFGPAPALVVLKWALESPGLLGRALLFGLLLCRSLSGYLLAAWRTLQRQR